MTEKITKYMVESWVGSDNMDADSFLNLLVDLINRDYPIYDFRADVFNYHGDFDTPFKKEEVDHA
jgi:hypothetical protein